MFLKFSNRRMWSILSIELIVVAIVFLFLALISRSQLMIALLFVVLMLIAIATAVYLNRLNDKDYLSFSHDAIVVTGIFGKVTTVLSSDIKRVIKKDHFIIIQREDLDDVRINLNYLTEDDIKRILMYLRFTPTIRSKFL